VLTSMLRTQPAPPHPFPFCPCSPTPSPHTNIVPHIPIPAPPSPHDLSLLPGKLGVLSSLVGCIMGAGERLVLVSTSTAALDLVDALLCGPAG
jgi:hypothetical protein